MGAKPTHFVQIQKPTHFVHMPDIILCGDDKRALSLHTDRYSLISRILLQLDWITGSEVDTLNRWVIFWQSPADIESIWAMNIPSISDEFAKQKAFWELVAILNKNLDYYTVLLSSGNHTWKKEQVLTTLRYIGALYLLVLHAFWGLQWNWSIHLDIATLGRYFRELDPIQTKRFDRWIWIFTQWVDTIFSDSSEQEKIALQFGAFFDNIMREFLSMRWDDTAWDFLSFTNWGLYDLFKELAILHPVVSSYKLRAVRDTERQEVA